MTQPTQPPQEQTESREIVSAFTDAPAFEAAQRMAKALVTSTLVPTTFQGMDNIGSAIIALEIAQRLKCSVLMVMQSIDIIYGRPSWRAQYVIAAINSSGKFKSVLRFKVRDLGAKKFEVNRSFWSKKDNRKIEKVDKYDLPNNMEFVAYAIDKNGDEVLGPAITYEMACREGWWDKEGSKWATMPELMGRYRAAAFFGRLYAPEVLMGMQTAEEVIDIGPAIEVERVSAPIFDGKVALPERTNVESPLDDKSKEAKADLLEADKKVAPSDKGQHVAPPSKITKRASSREEAEAELKEARDRLQAQNGEPIDGVKQSSGPIIHDHDLPWVDEEGKQPPRL